MNSKEFSTGQKIKEVICFTALCLLSSAIMGTMGAIAFKVFEFLIKF